MHSSKIRFLRSMQGLTLVEILVSVFIGGLLTLTIMSLFVYTSKNSTQLQQQAALTRDVQNFFYGVEQYMSQLTKMNTCACSPLGGAAPCRNDALVDNPSIQGTTNVITFDYEDALDPMEPTSSPSCLNAVNTLAGSTITPLGCKKRIALQYTPPTPEQAGQASKPGKLELIRYDPPPRVTLLTLNSVTSFGCGMRVSANKLSNLEMQLRIEAKAKANNTTNVLDPDYESWIPQGPQYAKGFRRTHFGKIFFRNLGMPGLHFGKMRSYKNCIADGKNTLDYRSCCSGYASESNTCIPARDCYWNSNSNNTTTGFIHQCCSRMNVTLGGTGGCL